MPRYDAHHLTVKRALLDLGWKITREQFGIYYKGLRLFPDLEAERSVSDGEEKQKAVIEIKVFGGHSLVEDFEQAVGQYLLYRHLFERRFPEQQRDIFLAVPQEIYEHFFLKKQAIEEFIAAQQIHLLIFDPEKEEVIQWIKWKS